MLITVYVTTMGDITAVLLTLTMFEPGKLVGVTVAPVTTVLPTKLGGGSAMAVMFTRLGRGVADDAKS